MVASAGAGAGVRGRAVAGGVVATHERARRCRAGPDDAYNRSVRPGEFDELAFFRAIAASGARTLLIGRRALVILGLPVLTADYDFWLAGDDIHVFNAVVARFGLYPSKEPGEARRTGRYAVENDEHVDVLVAAAVAAKTGEVVCFEDVWSRRQDVVLAGGQACVSLPSIDDLILTKKFALRPRDLEDIRLLEALKAGEQE